MTHALTKPGGWVDGVDSVTNAQLTDLDNKTVSAIDGTNGGVYSPINPIEIGGDGLEVSGLLTCSGTTYIAGSLLEVVCTMDTQGVWTHSADFDCSGPATFTDACVFGDDVTCNGDVLIGAAGTLSMHASSELTVACPAEFSGATELSGATTISGATTAANLTMTSTNRVKVASRTLSRMVRGMPSFESGSWAMTPSTFITTTNALTIINWPIEVPDGSRLEYIVLYITGGAGHAAMPTFPPVLSIRRIELDGTSTTLDTTTDTTVLYTDYELQHLLAVGSFVPPGLDETVDNQLYRYILTLATEWTGDAQSGLVVDAPRVQFTTGEYDDGAA